MKKGEREECIRDCTSEHFPKATDLENQRGCDFSEVLQSWGSKVKVLEVCVMAGVEPGGLYSATVEKEGRQLRGKTAKGGDGMI